MKNLIIKTIKNFTFVYILIFNFKLISNEQNLNPKQKNITINFDNIHMVEYIDCLADNQ